MISLYWWQSRRATAQKSPPIFSESVWRDISSEKIKKVWDDLVIVEENSEEEQRFGLWHNNELRNLRNNAFLSCPTQTYQYDIVDAVNLPCWIRWKLLALQCDLESFRPPIFGLFAIFEQFTHFSFISHFFISCCSHRKGILFLRSVRPTSKNTRASVYCHPIIFNFNEIGLVGLLAPVYCQYSSKCGPWYLVLWPFAFGQVLVVLGYQVVLDLACDFNFCG